MTPFEYAKTRVDESPALQPHRHVLLNYPWPEGDKHFLWVATADERDLLEWARDAERVFLRQVQQV